MWVCVQIFTHCSKDMQVSTESELLFISVKDPFDYQGRSFLHPPQDVGVNLRSEEPPEKCFLPKKQIFTWTGHTKGVSAIRWFPRYAHLLLSCSMDTKIKVSGFFFFFCLPFLLLPSLFLFFLPFFFFPFLSSFSLLFLLLLPSFSSSASFLFSSSFSSSLLLHLLPLLFLPSFFLLPFFLLPFYLLLPFFLPFLLLLPSFFFHFLLLLFIFFLLLLPSFSSSSCSPSVFY